MEKVLGLDLGTNSIGWAVIERKGDNSCVLLDKGVHIFQDGVAHDKSGEKPAVQERTAARSSRRHYFRRRLRKIELLKILVKNGFCPFLSDEDLKKWKNEKIYPLNDEFIKWQHTDTETDKNPYHDRYTAVMATLDLTEVRDRYVLGRALYHLNQRRGFLSNRKDVGEEQKDGIVKEGISRLSEDMSAAGCKYIGEYFYKLYKEKKKIRTHYTAREEHYKEEFKAICNKQQLGSNLTKALERAIFYQRPLKSQKGNVGKCSFEKRKPRCPVSHPRYEEFRMLQFINSIRVKGPEDEDFRSLNHNETELILPLFFRKSKADFDFEEIAKKLAGKGNYGHKDGGIEVPYLFNYKMTTSVSGCPVTSAIIQALGEEYNGSWVEDLCALYTKGEGKNQDLILNDIWHALYSFDDDKKLTDWLRISLQLDEEKAKTLAKLHLPQGFASLSLMAVNKILPWLRKGLIYSEAVFYANLNKVLPASVTGDSAKMKEVYDNISVCLEDFDKNPLNRTSNKASVISDYLVTVAEGVKIEKLYHPSMIETYPSAQKNEHGKIRLGSPRVSAFKNPMAMRALFRLRALVNTLLDEKVIDPGTKINIEFSRELNDANTRKAIGDWNKEQEDLRKKYREEIKNLFGDNYEPTEDDILKYRLYEEQKHICLYTGKQISPTMFLGNASAFDIEHTVPRSRGGDDSLANKTLCESKYNREIKKTKLPSELPEHETILQRVEEWKSTVEDLDKRLSAQRRKCKAATTKDQKDAALRTIHYLKMKRAYWKGKYDRFVMKEVPEGFSNRQGVDIGIIGRYARLYLKTIFQKTYVVKGATTADFRKAWGLQEEYSKKERVNHAHHCIDAITIACIGKGEYEKWAQYMRQLDNHLFWNDPKPHFEKPWSTFTEDVLAVPSSLIVSHYTPDNLPKQSRKKVRVRGIIQKSQDGKPLYAQGDTARALLHKDTFYGAIQKNGEIRYVVRKAIDTLKESDIQNIVDEAIREKVKAAVDRHGNLKKAVAETIWMNEEKKVPIKKVRVFTPTITNPIALKAHRDLSNKDYKREYYVSNDSNYCMAIYGENKPSFKLFSMLSAVNHFNGKQEQWIESQDEQGRPLRCVLKIGTMVLFYENTPKELCTCSQKELTERLYKVTGLSSMTIQRKYHYGTITLKHHQEAKNATELNEKKGLWQKGELYRPVIGLNHNQSKFLVEGKDFTLTVTGRIILKKND